MKQQNLEEQGNRREKKETKEKKNENKHNAELQRADPGTKVTG